MTTEDFVQQQLQLLRQLQNDVNFIMRQQKEAEEKKAAARSKAAAKRRELAQEREPGLPPADPEKQAKAIFKARKQKRIDDQQREDTGKKLPPRVGGPNLDGKVRVRLDSKTEVWAAPGADIEMLKKKYLRKASDIIPIGDDIADKPYRKRQELLPGQIYDLVKKGGQ